MARSSIAALVLLGSLGALARAGDPPPPPPEPPTTPLPAFENPLHDAEVGETCLFKVSPPGQDDAWVLWFEERVLARRRVKDKDRVLVETVKTDATNSKDFGIDVPRSGWRDGGAQLVLPPRHRWIDEKRKDEVLVVGTPAVAVRTTRRVIELPPEGNLAPKTLQVWYSHDVPVLGRAKQFPAAQHRDGERVVVSWSRRLPPDECARRAARYRDEEMEQAGMDDPPMGEPGMDEPGMGEPAMGEPGMDEPGMDEPGMDEPGMSG